MTKLINADHLQRVCLFSDQDLLAAGVNQLFREVSPNAIIVHKPTHQFPGNIEQLSGVSQQMAILVDLPELDQTLWQSLKTLSIPGAIIVILPFWDKAPKLHSEVVNYKHIIGIQRSHAIRDIKGLLFPAGAIALQEEKINDQIRQAVTSLDKDMHLTAREIEVVKEIYNAHTNREIAEMFHISIQTVNVHRKNIMKKLEVNNTVALVRKVQNLGIVAV